MSTKLTAANAKNDAAKTQGKTSLGDIDWAKAAITSAPTKMSKRPGTMIQPQM